MKISLVDVDGHNFPNFALMKISAFHKAQGDTVDWYNPLFSQPERIAAIDSKIIPFCMPYRNLDGDGLIADAGVKKLARWCNISSIRKTTKWGDYKG